jgi:hypothetical protein
MISEIGVNSSRSGIKLVLVCAEDVVFRNVSKMKIKKTKENKCFIISPLNNCV